MSYQILVIDLNNNRVITNITTDSPIISNSPQPKVVVEETPVVAGQEVVFDNRSTDQYEDIPDFLTTNRRLISAAKEFQIPAEEVETIVKLLMVKMGRNKSIICNGLTNIFRKLAQERTLNELNKLGMNLDLNMIGTEKLEEIALWFTEESNSVRMNKAKELIGGRFQVQVVEALIDEING